MIRLYSIEQAVSLRGTIPELAVTRAIQFMGDGYNPEEHGHIIVFEQGDDITQIKEIGTNGLFDDGFPAYEGIEAFMDGDRTIYEVIFQLDCDRTIAIIIPDETWLDNGLRESLKTAPY